MFFFSTKSTNKWVEIRAKKTLRGPNTAVCKQIILFYPSPNSNAILDKIAFI